MGYYPRLRDLREDKDLSIRKLADILHMQRTTYHNYETGKRELPFELAIILAKYYNVSLDYIAGITNTPTPIDKIKNREARASLFLYPMRFYGTICRIYREYHNQYHTENYSDLSTQSMVAFHIQGHQIAVKQHTSKPKGNSSYKAYSSFQIQPIAAVIQPSHPPFPF